MPIRRIIKAVDTENLDQLESLFGKATGLFKFFKHPFGINYQYQTEQKGYSFLKNSWGLKDRSETPLGLACRLGRLTSVQKLLDLGADITAYSCPGEPIAGEHVSPIFIAAYYGHYYIVHELSNRGARFTLEEVKRLLTHMVTYYHTPYINAESRVLICRHLLNTYPDLANSEISSIGSNPVSLLYRACSWDRPRSYDGNVFVVKELVDHGADIHYRTSDGRTPFFAAALACNKDTVTYLLDKFGKNEINLDQKDKEGRSIVYRLLHKKGQEEEAMAEFLVEHGYHYKMGDGGISDYRGTHHFDGSAEHNDLRSGLRA